MVKISLKREIFFLKNVLTVQFTEVILDILKRTKQIKRKTNMKNIVIATIASIASIVPFAQTTTATVHPSCCNNGVGNNITVDIILTEHSLYDVKIDPGNKGQMKNLKKELLELGGYTEAYIDWNLAKIVDLEKKYVEQKSKNCVVVEPTTEVSTNNYPAD